ncbi:PREDICTED: tumor necrosis factor receptor superfamily member 1A-like [Gekko japonicus]|uniref:Tumor necrosis factor receptor superfamily member 1A-like n=1 Tax=Gekko japonicus TaxID=146911 RepID=A0ABM1L232_GEKJA|nr:PREDICTED: tumor necrosis factor receptor superfamily member 1A-like [Gekko japonicus]
MVWLGLFPAFAATVTLILIQMNTGECLGIHPIPSDVHSHGVLADKRPFIHPGSRERRNVMCRSGYYPHPNRTHCCMLCHKGNYVAQHCVSEDMTPDCTPCPEGSFTDWENSAGNCRGCQRCYANLGQVALTNCSRTQDTVCGCPSNHYRTNDSPEFSCKPCSACHNGTILKKCTTSSDTVCRCHKGFFLQTRKNSCSPCSSCQGEECKQDCDVTSESISPPNSPDLLRPILGCLVVVFAAAFLLLAVKQLIKQPMRKKLISTFCGAEQQPSPDPQLPQPGGQGTRIPEKSNQEETLLPPRTIAVSPNTQGLPDSLQHRGETQIPDSPAVLYAVIDNVPFSQWKEFVRHLGLTENDILRIQVEEWNMRDAQYKMLSYWRQQSGQCATRERIRSVLQEMELSGCSEVIQEAWSSQASRLTRGPQERGSAVHIFVS